MEELKKRSLYRYGSFYEMNSNGKYITYRKRANCIYPKCKGIVYLEDAPPREKENNHDLVGVCHVGGRMHSYTYDANGIGYPKEFDWRPLDTDDNK